MKHREESSKETMSLQNLQTQLSDIKLRTALLEYAGQEDEESTAYFDKLPKDSPMLIEEIAFFSRTTEKTLRLIRMEDRKLKRLKSFSRFQKIMKYAALLLLISFLSLGTAMAVSSDLRIQALRLLYRVTPQYTEVSYVPENPL